MDALLARLGARSRSPSVWNRVCAVVDISSDIVCFEIVKKPGDAVQYPRLLSYFNCSWHRFRAMNQQHSGIMRSHRMGMRKLDGGKTVSNLTSIRIKQ
jgi:hypothetical protein